MGDEGGAFSLLFSVKQGEWIGGERGRRKLVVNGNRPANIVPTGSDCCLANDSPGHSLYYRH